MSSEANKPDDHELEDFLHGASRIGAAYREAVRQDGAPRELDAAILAMAREAVATQQRRGPRWIQPMAVAATLALSLGVLLNIWRDPAARRQLESEADPMREASTASATPSEKMSADSEPKSEASALADSALRQLEPAPESRKKERATEPSAPLPPPAPMAKSADALGAASADQAPVLSEPSSQQDKAVAPLEERRPAPAALEREEVQKSMRREVLSVERDRAATEAASGAPAAAAAPMERDDAAPENESEDISPEQWIEGIRARIAQGDASGARAAMKDFREAYPGHVLPEDLKPYDDTPPR